MGAQNRRVLSISDKAKGLFSAMRTQSPPHIRARPMRSGRVCSCQAVVPSKSTVIMPNPFRFKYTFIIIAFSPSVKSNPQKNARSSILRRSMRSRKRLSDSSMPIQRAIANAAETAVKRTFEARSGLQLPRQADEAHLRNHATDAAPPFASVFHGIPSLSAQKISLCDRIYPLASHVNAAETAV